MRWKKKQKKIKNTTEHYSVGDTRIITKFLFFPKCINDEYRWLEFANIKQVLEKQTNWEYFEIVGYYEYEEYVWVDKEWI